MSREDINPDVANIEITQEDDDDEGKSSKKKKKKKDKSKKEEQDEEEKEEEFTEEEKKLYKIYKRAFHLLRKAIRSYNRRNKIEPEKDLENRFNKWKNGNSLSESVKKNLIGEYNKDEEIKESNDTNSNKEKEVEIKQLSHTRKDDKKEVEKEDTKAEKEDSKEDAKDENEEKEEEEEEKNEKLDKKEEDNKKEEKGEVEENKEIKVDEKKEEEKGKEKEKEEETKGGEKKEELKKDEEEEEEEENEDEDKNKEEEGSEKEKVKGESLDNNNILTSIDELIKSNNKIQNSAFNIIKRSGEKIYDKIDPQNFVKILELNNKRISAYQIFCLYTNYNENPPLCIKTIFPKKSYFNYWYKQLINKADK